MQLLLEKKYEEPIFELVKTDGRNRVFFAVSGTPSPTGSIATMSGANGAW